VSCAVAFPPEAVWNASGGEAEEAGSDLLCFTIANEEFAIDIQRVWEIIRPRRVTEIPGVPEFISGIIALRGEIVPVLDLRRRLGFPPTGTAQATAKIIVAVHDGRRIGMGVDAVSHKIHVLEDQVTQPNALIGGQESGFLTGVCRHQGRLIAILNADGVLAFQTGAEGIAADIPSGAPGERGAQGGAR
jgi:purine-binding chemotaxis protein CheW